MNVGSFFDERKYSWIPEEKPDPDKYPLYYKASCTEIVLNEGEMVYIPAGWWHHVFSEAVGNRGLNIAVNYWYDCPDDLVEGLSGKETPYKQSVDKLVCDPVEILKSVKSVRVFRSATRRFTSDRISYRYPGTLEVLHMSPDEFLKTKDPCTYILQFGLQAFDKFAPRHPRQLRESSTWVNFGNVYSHLHYDLYDNYLYQVEGTRRILLFPPEDRCYLYPLNPYPLEIIRQLKPIAVNKYKVLIGTYSPDGYVSSIYTSSIAETVARAGNSDIYLDHVVITSNKSDTSVYNELAHIALEKKSTHLFLIHRDMSWNACKFIESVRRDFDAVSVPYVQNNTYFYCVPESVTEADNMVESLTLPLGFVGFTRKVLEKLWLNAPIHTGVFGTPVRDIFNQCLVEPIKKYGFRISVFTDYAATMINHTPIQAISIQEQNLKGIRPV